MKTFLSSVMILALSLGSAYADAKVKAGPKGGRILELEGKNAEFFVETDRKVTITFYGADMKPEAAAEQVVVATAEAPGGKQKLEFEKKGDVLISTTALPTGENYTVVVQVKENAGGKSKNFRIPLQLYICKGCSRVEYACTCDE